MFVGPKHYSRHIAGYFATLDRRWKTAYGTIVVGTLTAAQRNEPIPTLQNGWRVPSFLAHKIPALVASVVPPNVIIPPPPPVPPPAPVAVPAAIAPVPPTILQNQLTAAIAARNNLQTQLGTATTAQTKLQTQLTVAVNAQTVLQNQIAPLQTQIANIPAQIAAATATATAPLHDQVKNLTDTLERTTASLFTAEPASPTDFAIPILRPQKPSHPINVADFTRSTYTSFQLGQMVMKLKNGMPNVL